MSTQVDLSGLAYERKQEKHRRLSVRQIVTRYVVPGVILAGLIAVLVIAAWDLLVPRTPVTTVPVHVSRAEVQQQGTPLFKAAGWVEPRPTPIAVPALEPGVVEELLVVEDQVVAEGEPVARLVDEDTRLMLSAAKAAYSLAEAELARAESQLSAARIRLEQPVHLNVPLSQARGSLAAAKTKLADLPFKRRTALAQLEFARRDFEGKSRASGAVSQRTIDQAKSELDAAQSLVDQYEQQEESLTAEIEALQSLVQSHQRLLELKTEEQRQFDEAKANVSAAQARLEQAAIAWEEAQLAYNRMTVRAPVAGRVWQLWASPGARLAAGMGGENHDCSTVVTMYQSDRLQARVDVRFDDLPQVQPGQGALIEIPAIPEPLQGEVLFASSLADIQKNTLQVKVAIHKPPALLKPEMLVDVTFLAPELPEEVAAAEVQQHLYVPKNLVKQS